MSEKVVPFNPLDKRNLGASVAEALLASRLHVLGDIQSFQGAGIYAIYYVGDFPAYKAIKKWNADDRFLVPIYVGKAVPEGARKGGGAGESRTKSLFKRLMQHAGSIRAVSNLHERDFFCRYLVVEDIWIPLGESLLIARFAPIWNCVVEGFGNHDTGKGRHLGLRPRWDTLHPGRPWAGKCQERPETAEDIIREVKTYLRDTPFPVSTRFIGDEKT